MSCFKGRHGAAADGLVADGPDEMRLAVRKEIKSGADWIKVLATGAFMASSEHDSPEFTHMSSQELDAVSTWGKFSFCFLKCFLSSTDCG